MIFLCYDHMFYLFLDLSILYKYFLYVFFDDIENISHNEYYIYIIFIQLFYILWIFCEIYM